MSDYYNIIDSAEKRAREEGLLQGRLQGREEGRMEVVQKLLASGMPIESIAKILEIPEDILQQML